MSINCVMFIIIAKGIYGIYIIHGLSYVFTNTLQIYLDNFMSV